MAKLARLSKTRVPACLFRPKIAVRLRIPFARLRSDPDPEGGTWDSMDGSISLPILSREQTARDYLAVLEHLTGAKEARRSAAAA